ncbi:MAG: PEP/pyruvate-binding domain-containing protein [Syntrophobacteraceae bacterium]|nr:PEP/pyruvate-binding domain-containing protein [Syntrophobacteraceae bacterium]
MQNPLIIPFGRTDPGNIELLGAKGARLAEDYRDLRQIFPGMDERIAVPDGFILTTEAWRLFDRSQNTLPDPLFESTLSEISSLEERTGRKFGDTSGGLPLLVAVRGGAPVSLPGALATALNVGFNDEVASAMIGAGEDESFVLTTYLTSIRMYGEVVLDIPYDNFYRIINDFGVEGAIPVSGLKTLIAAFKGVLDKADHPICPPGFETGPHRQLKNVIEAVFGSWMSPIAVEARFSRERPGESVPDSMGTAAIVQRMVFGNRDDKSLSGVLFTREQRSGANHPIIEWAPKVQCDKIVSGKLRKDLLQAEDLRVSNPAIHQMLLLVRDAFECRAKRPIDIEFTVESGRVFILQRRPMRTTCSATVRAMWDMVDEGKTSIQLASLAINQALSQPEKGLREGFTDFQVLASGEPITDSADAGVLVFGSDAALELAEKGQDVILLRRSTFGKGDLAVNHPRVRGIVRVDGHTTSHEAVSAVAYGKPYLIKTRDANGKPLTLSGEEGAILNPESVVTSFIGKNVFLDGERGIMGHTPASGFLEDRRLRKKLYVDWEYLKEQFDAGAYENCGYPELLDVHYQWELELESHAEIEKQLTAGRPIPEIRLLHTFDTWLRCFRQADRIKAMGLKDVRAEDFEPGPPLAYHGRNLPGEVRKILSTLKLSTTWWTHWIHEILVQKAIARGETENDVIRDINLKNRTMSLLAEFEKEGFHLMKTAGSNFLVFASNFEYEQNPDSIQVGSGALDYMKKDLLAQRFMEYLKSIDEPLGKRVRLINGEPPLGQGHARIVSVGLAAPEADFALMCRYLRAFLDHRGAEHPADVLSLVPRSGFIELYQVDPFFASYPEFRVTRQTLDQQELFLSFGDCSFGEYEGKVYGKEDYERLTVEMDRFLNHLKKKGAAMDLRPWNFEIDPYRRHSLIAASGLRFSESLFGRVLQELREFIVNEQKSGMGSASPLS